MLNELAEDRPVVSAGEPPAASDTPVLSVRNMNVRFTTEGGDVQAVRGLSYDVYPGEILAIVGESGSGKSVSSLAIMRLLADNAKVTVDRMVFDGLDLQGLSRADMRALRGKGIGMIFQDPMMALNPVMTVGEQLTEPLRIHLGLSPAAARDRALELLGLVGIPDAATRIDQYPHQFSGGMRQRVMIAIGLSCHPKMLIADEPTTALDVTIQAQILDLMQDLCHRLQIALVIITHNLGVVARYADRVLVMYGGRMMEQGACRPLFQSPRHLYTAGLLASVPTLEGPLGRRLAGIEGTPPSPTNLPPGCPFAPRCMHAQPACAQEMEAQLTDVGTLSACVRANDLAAGSIRWTTGLAEAPAAAPAKRDGDALVEVSGLQKTFVLKKGLFGARGHVQALRDVNLIIRPGETIGVVGESGCGKSTLGRLLLRLDEPSGGQVRFRGDDITHRGDRALRSFRRHTQVVFQDPYSSLNPRQRIGSILTEPMLVHGIAANRAEAGVEAVRLLQEVGLRPEHAERYPHQLSGGQRQRVAIARALAMRPEFIVCDEAVSALDVSVQAQVVNLLADLQERMNLAYLFIGHDLAVVRQIATKVVVMYLGRVVEVADRDSFYAQPLHPYAQVLMAAVPSTEQIGMGTVQAQAIRGEPPSPLSPPSGCAFRTRCSLATDECARTVPELRSVAPGRLVACLKLA